MSLPQIKSFLANQLNLLALLVIFVPVLTTFAVLASGVIVQVQGFTWGLLLVCYCLTVLGITVGYHRYLTHRSFTTGKVVKTILIALGCMAYEGPPSFWVGVHRKHHISPDTQIDPHSPYRNEHLNFKTFWHSHVGWMFNIDVSEWRPYVKDLKGCKIIRFANKYYLPIALSGLFIPALINGLYYRSWYQFWIGLLLCGVVRVFLQHQVTWSINSVCHVWGKTHFKTNDNSKNNALLGILALGEGWHNGHHAFPGSARHGLLWWQVDLSYAVIRFLNLLGLANNVRLVNKVMIEKKLLKNSAVKMDDEA